MSGTSAAKCGLAALLLLVAGCSAKGCRGAAPAEDKPAAELNPQVPGLEPDAAFVAKLKAAYEAKGPGYSARTHHKDDEGVPRYTNRLMLETSPYLLQHAHNPVSWFPWGDEAFERARRENKPVLLSVGYSTCHWCHVMERESFEDEEIARYLNEHFVSIKVDREERPDVDDVYMSAVHLLAGRGGWPMTVVLTPEKKPFFGGTYFPARDGDRGARKGFLTILGELQQRYATDPEGVVEEAEGLTRKLQASASRLRPSAVPGPDALVSAARSLAQSFDALHGGFAQAPKFPRPVTLDFLLRYHRRTSDPQALAIVTHTLDKMANGGLYDHVGGGFHRYSTDSRWLVPHFEKMLYDNAQLVVTYLEAHQATGEERYAEVAKDVLRYVAREMTAPGGAFYSATDADSLTPSGHEEEGWFFTWTPQELEAVLGPERARVVATYYGVTPRGNFEGRNIFHVERPAGVVADELGIDEGALLTELSAARAQLYEQRRTRPAPILDDKVITAWNGLMISAFARAALVLDDDDLRARAEAAARFLLDNLRDDSGRLHRIYKDGTAKEMAVLDDYAFVIQGLLDLYEASFDPTWLDEAARLQAIVDERYADEPGGGYFRTADDAEDLLTREKPSYDGAEPSGTSVTALNLLRLAELGSDEALRERAEKTLGAFAMVLTRSGTSAPKMLAALDFYLDTALEIAIVRPEGDEASAKALLDVVGRSFVPNRVLASVAEGPSLSAAKARIPLLDGKLARGGKVTAYVCEKGVCELPTSDPGVFARQLGKVRAMYDERTAPPLPVREPGKAPTPWQYDPKTNRHWDPGHGHWHDGPPPAGKGG